MNGTRKRLSREMWLQKALAVIGSGGHGKLRIHDLVNDLGVTRGSFYWHFNGREDFICSLAEYWAQWSTGQVVEAIDSVKSHPQDKLRVLLRMVIEQGLTDYDLTMESWAHKEPAVAEVVAEVMRLRVGFVRTLFRELGFVGDELETRTVAFVGFVLFSTGTNGPETKDEQLRLVESRYAFFTRE